MSFDLSPAPSVTLSDSVEKFLRLYTADGSARPRTLDAYRQNIAYFVEWARGKGLNPREAVHEDILNYRAELVAGQYKRSTIRLRLTSVRLLYKSLQRWGARADNPAEGIGAPRGGIESQSSVLLAKAPSQETLKKLTELPLEGRDGAMLRLFILHGLRAGEMAALTLDDLSKDGAQLSVPGKGGKRRTLILNYRCRQDMALFNVHDEKGHIFKRRGGRGGMSVRSIERLVNKYLTLVGAKEPGKSCHSLRHGCAILATLGGAKKEALAASFGHSSTATTDIYAMAAAAIQENPATAVERMLQ